ncbi:MAG: hypothetical protein ABIG43_07130 [Chloroflexota bacterium]
MVQVADPDRRDVIRSVAYLLVYVIVLGAGAFLLIPKFWYIWIALAVVGVLIMVNWHKEQTAYRCPNCEHIYKISFLTDLTAPHGFNHAGGWLLLRCPNCRLKRKTKVLKIVK